MSTFASRRPIVEAGRTFFRRARRASVCSPSTDRMTSPRSIPFLLRAGSLISDMTERPSAKLIWTAGFARPVYRE